MRPPYTEDWICRVHQRLGNHPDEQACSPTLFMTVLESKIAPLADVAPEAPVAEAGKRYRRKPDPPEVRAVAFGALMIINNGQGPDYPMPRDQFHALYEEIPGDDHQGEGALDRMIDSPVTDTNDEE